MTNFIHSSPSSWDKKLEEKSGKPYYIHYYSCEDTSSRNKTPNRILYDHLQHRSPSEIKRNLIHPNNNSTPIIIEAFTENSMDEKIMKNNKSTKSPLLKLKCAKIQDIPISTTSISSASNSSEDASAVTKISTMFPTVSETHIKLLLNKYLNREALVISALQVEKYPITTPGPFSTPPPQQRNIQIFNINKDSKSSVNNINNNNNNNNGQIIMKNHLHYHSSPKMKLRYMKSIFPNADETLILDCLQNNENSIQKTSENLIEMGYSKRETVKPLTPRINPKNNESVDKNHGKNSPEVLLEDIRKTINEKDQIKNNLKIQYDDVPEHLISIALESVNFNENRAKQILEIMKQEDEKLTIKVTNNENKSEVDFKTNKTQIPSTQSRQSLKSLLINKTEKKENFNRFSRVLNPDDDNNNNNNDGFKSFNLSNTLGHNAALSKGPNQKLLLENYVQWQGTNRTLSKGSQNLAKGPNKNLIFKSLYKPFGPNMELGQGAFCALVKGSIFNQQKLIID